MVGFRQTRNIASVPFRSNIGGIGFRDATNYFNLSPITAGPRVTNYTDLSDYTPSYVPPPPPPAPVYDSSEGMDDNIPGPGSYQDWEGSSTWGNVTAWDDDMGDANLNNTNNDDAGDDHNGQDDNPGGHSSGGDSFGAQSGDYGSLSHSHGGKIPPLYAYDGLTKQERDRAAILAQREAARKPRSTLEFTYPDLTQVPQNAMDAIKSTEIYQGIAGLPERFSDAGRFAASKAEDVTKNALGVPDNREILDTTRNLVRDSIGFDPVNPVKSSFMNTIENPILSGVTALGQAAATKAGFPAAAAYLVGNEIKNQIPQQEKDKLNIANPFSIMSQELYDAVYDGGDDYGYTPSQIENARIAAEQEPAYGVNIGTVPTIDMTNPANYNIKDFVGIPEFTTSDISQEIDDEIQNIVDNKGAIYGDYSSPKASLNTAKKNTRQPDLSDVFPLGYEIPDEIRKPDLSDVFPSGYEIRERPTTTTKPDLSDIFGPNYGVNPEDIILSVDLSHLNFPSRPSWLGPATTMSINGNKGDPNIINKISGTPTYNDFVAKTPEEYQAIIDDLNATINNTLSSDMFTYNGVSGVADGGDGGGWADGGFYNDDGTDFGTNEYSGGQPTTGDAFTDAMNDTDQFGLSRGGHIYASKGGYVNSVGGK